MIEICYECLNGDEECATCAAKKQAAIVAETLRRVARELRDEALLHDSYARFRLRMIADRLEREANGGVA